MLWLLFGCVVKGEGQRQGLHLSGAGWMLPSPQLYYQGVMCFAFASCQSHQGKKASSWEI